jgi:hypothetical protein
MLAKKLINDSLAIFNALKEVAPKWEKNDPERFNAMRNSIDFILFQLDISSTTEEASSEEE